MHETYQEILNKKAKGDPITIDETLYVEDYEAYLVIILNACLNKKK